jgi:hypothetical protein
MRPIIDSMILMLVVTLLIGVVSYRKASERRERELATVRQALVQFDDKLALHSVLWQSEEEDAGEFPPQVMPEWFKEGMPSNPLASGDRPWVDIAPAGDYRDQPPDPLAEDAGQAAFWYNPNLGIVRARVPRQVSHRLTLDLYNKVNGTALRALPVDEDPDRAPLAFNPNPVTSVQHASLDKRATSDVQTSEPVEDLADDEADYIPWWQKRTYKAESAEEPTTTPAVDRPSLIAQ